jgi:uncharacterized membrane protein
LFRMRRLAAYLFTATLALSFVSWAWQLAVGRIGKELLQNHLFDVSAGTAIAVLVCVYSWFLLRRGYLR